MKLSELVPAVKPMTEAEETRFLEKLWYLLARQTELYTMGESTSVPMETARELLSSICYTIEFELDLSNLSISSLPECDLNELLKRGQTHLLEEVKEAKKLWMQAYTAAQKQGKLEIMEDLAWIRPFFSEYDVYFAAHKTPWDMGLPMPEPKGEPQRGISCVVAYVKSRLQFDLT